MGHPQNPVREEDTMTDEAPLEPKPYPDGFLGLHKGDIRPCVVLGNGPSINDHKLTSEFFKNAITFGTNAIGLRIFPTYYLITDKRAWDWYRPMVIKSVGKGSHLVLGASQLRRIRGHKLPAPPKDFFVISYNPDNVIGEPVLGGPIYHGRTAGIIALNLAFQMGCNPVYMLGIDGFAIPKTHFHKLHKKEIDKVHSKDERDDVVLQNLILIRKAFEKDNRRIIDLSTRSIWKGAIPRGKPGD